MLRALRTSVESVKKLKHSLRYSKSGSTSSAGGADAGRGSGRSALDIEKSAADDDDLDDSWCSRHFGTDALLGSWCLLVASALYAAYGIDLVVECWDDSDAELPVVVWAWGNAVSGVMFTVGAAYFVKLSYPEELARCAHEALNVDIDSLTFVQRYFTFNDMLLATWSFEIACLPYLAIAFADIFWGVQHGDARTWELGVFYLIGSFVCIGCLYVWVLSAMPSFMQQNGGAGSSWFYEHLAAPMFGRCCDETMRRHVGTDLQAGGWLFFGPTTVATVGSLALVAYEPTSFEAWSFAVQLSLLSVGAGLLLRSMYPNSHEEVRLLAA